MKRGLVGRTVTRSPEERNNLGRRIQIRCTQSLTERVVIFHTDHPNLPHMRVTVSEMVDVRDQSVFLRMYIRELVKAGVMPEDIDYSHPNVYRHIAAMMPDPKWVYTPAAPTIWNPEGLEKLQRDAPLEADFEVNMMECLVGWKGWRLNKTDGLLHSPSQDLAWEPDKAITALCHTGCKAVPREHHTCGVYATDKPIGARDYGQIKGMVYGWGRYVRGNDGWRAQFAYPKSFHLTEDQVEFIEPLKKYHVPIYINQPVKIYNPEEDGYGHWEEQENRDRGAVENPFASEAGDSGEDDED